MNINCIRLDRRPASIGGATRSSIRARKHEGREGHEEPKEPGAFIPSFLHVEALVIQLGCGGCCEEPENVKP